MAISSYTYLFLSISLTPFFFNNNIDTSMVFAQTKPLVYQPNSDFNCGLNRKQVSSQYNYDNKLEENKTIKYVRFSEKSSRNLEETQESIAIHHSLFNGDRGLLIAQNSCPLPQVQIDLNLTPELNSTPQSNNNSYDPLNDPNFSQNLLGNSAESFDPLKGTQLSPTPQQAAPSLSTTGTTTSPSQAQTQAQSESQNTSATQGGGGPSSSNGSPGSSAIANTIAQLQAQMQAQEAAQAEGEGDDGDKDSNGALDFFAQLQEQAKPKRERLPQIKEENQNNNNSSSKQTVAQQPTEKDTSKDDSKLKVEKESDSKLSPIIKVVAPVGVVSVVAGGAQLVIANGGTVSTALSNLSSNLSNLTTPNVVPTNISPEMNVKSNLGGIGKNAKLNLGDAAESLKVNFVVSLDVSMEPGTYELSIAEDESIIDLSRVINGEEEEEEEISEDDEQ